MIRVEQIVVNDGRQRTLTSLGVRVSGSDLYVDEYGNLYTCGSIQLRTCSPQTNSRDTVVSARVGGRDRILTNLHIRTSAGDLYRDERGSLFVSSNGRTFTAL